MWRPRSIPKIVEEIETMVDRYGIREIVINDDQFLMKKERVHEFCDAFISRGLGISFSYEAGVSTWLVDEPLLAKMRRAGFFSLKFAIESGCAETLRFIRKPVNLETTKTLIATANRLGFWTFGNFLIGFPNETRDQIQETVDFAYGSNLDYAVFHIVKAHAGSELYEILKREGLLEQTVVRGSNFYRSDSGTGKITAEELNGLLLKASGNWMSHKFRLYMNPLHLWTHVFPKFRTMADFRYAGKLAWRLVGKKIIPNVKQRSRGRCRRPGSI